MDVKAYIESGVLQDYCLGFLSDHERTEVDALAVKYPEIKNEIEAFRNSLHKYAEAFSKESSSTLRTKILDNLSNLAREEKTSMESLPVLNKYSNHKNWLNIVRPLLPEKLQEEIHIQVLRNDSILFQTLIWTKIDYPDEVHDDLKECFMILEGECECYIGDEVIQLGPGGFLDIPLHVHHDVKVIKGPVLAIVQRLKVA